jgi:hypothetical protein
MADARSRSDLEALAHQIAVRKGVDPTLVKAVIEQESNWNPNAKSSAGASGLMQLMPATARGLGVKNILDPVENLTGGIEYLKQQINRFGDVGLALAAYNWGPARVAKLQYDPRSVRIPDETQKYVPGVIGRMGKYGDQLVPSATTAALFPQVRDSVVSAIQGKVNARTGAAPMPADIEREIRSLNARAPGVPQGGPVASGDIVPASGGASTMPTAAAIEAPAVTAGAEGTPPEASQSALALLTPQAASRGQTQNLDQFLRARFGPLADLADPFPKTFDAELARLIDRA